MASSGPLVGKKAWKGFEPSVTNSIRPPLGIQNSWQDILMPWLPGKVYADVGMDINDHIDFSEPILTSIASADSLSTFGYSPGHQQPNRSERDETNGAKITKPNRKIPRCPRATTTTPIAIPLNAF